MVDTARLRFPADMAGTSQVSGTESLESYASGAVERVKRYARDEPVNFALWAFGVGFVLGWKLKPW